MEKVFSGDFQISLQINLAGEIPQEINVNVNEVGKNKSEIESSKF